MQDLLAAQDPDHQLARLVEFRAKQLKSESTRTEWVFLRRCSTDLKTACMRKYQRRVHLFRFKVFCAKTHDGLTPSQNADPAQDVHRDRRIFKMKRLHQKVVFVAQVAVGNYVFRLIAELILTLQPAALKENGIEIFQVFFRFF